MGHVTGREPSKPQHSDISGREPKLGKDALRKHSDETPIESWDDPRITWGNAHYQRMELSIPRHIVQSVLRSFRSDNVVCLQAHKIHGTEDETRLYLKIITPNSPNFTHWDERGGYSADRYGVSGVDDFRPDSATKQVARNGSYSPFRENFSSTRSAALVSNGRS